MNDFRLTRENNLPISFKQAIKEMQQLVKVNGRNYVLQSFKHGSKRLSSILNMFQLVTHIAKGLQYILQFSTPSPFFQLSCSQKDLVHLRGPNRQFN